MDSRDRHSGRNVALVGGAALLAWWLFRGRLGLGAGGVDAVGIDTTTTPNEPCHLWIRKDRIELDGARTDLASAVARCHERGRAEVHATGDAITRSILDVLRALQREGVSIEAAPDLMRLAHLATEQTR